MHGSTCEHLSETRPGPLNCPGACCDSSTPALALLGLQLGFPSCITWRMESQEIPSCDIHGCGRPCSESPQDQKYSLVHVPQGPLGGRAGVETCEHVPTLPPPSAFSGESSACSDSQNLPVSLPVPEPDQVNGIYTQAKSFQPPRLFLSSSTRCQLMVNLQEFSSWQTQSPSTFSFTSWLKKNQEGQLVSGELSVADRTSAHFADARPVQEQLQQQL